MPDFISDMEQPWSRGKVWRRKLLYPAHTLPTAAAPLLVAVGLAAHDQVLALPAAFLAFIAGWLIQVGGVLTDNYENLLHEPEDQEHPELVRALKLGTLSLAELRVAIMVSYSIALLIGSYLLYSAGPFVLLIGVLSIAASWAYSAGPWPIGRHGLADPLFFLFFGVVSVVGGYYVQAAPVLGATWDSWLVLDALSASALALGVPIGALTTNILIIDDIRDREFDAVKGKHSVAVRFGNAWSRAEFLALLLIAYVVPLCLWLVLGFSAWILLPWLTAPYAVATARIVLTLHRYEDLVPVTPQAGRLLLFYALLLAIGAAAPSS
ncbi:MAG: 1,4-dihydroxy-2-naphtoate prenyltransferase [Geminicoccaceae bacterium]|jgi:1,4-dihydroxy-2-naphthoate octaprenyltransferase|nr:1,4-dihydroxy-2-naphtoate prenyltransferase [Geminicoccaceae bacterium]